jgi:hypothetical protein
MFYNGPAAACALGAAQEGGYLMGRLVALPQNLWVKIARRNDNGHTREQIADWLCREGRCQHGWCFLSGLRLWEGIAPPSHGLPSSVSRLPSRKI